MRDVKLLDLNGRVFEERVQVPTKGVRQQGAICGEHGRQSFRMGRESWRVPANPGPCGSVAVPGVHVGIVFSKTRAALELSCPFITRGGIESEREPALKTRRRQECRAGTGFDSDCWRSA